MGKSKVLAGGFCLGDSEAEQKVLQLLHIYCSLWFKSHSDDDVSQKGLSVLNLLVFLHPNLLPFIAQT